MDKGYKMKTIESVEKITFDSLYKLEIELDEGVIIGKERFVILSEFFSPLATKFVRVLDVGGNPKSSSILKLMFRNCYLTRLNVSAKPLKNGLGVSADDTILADISKVIENASPSYDIVFLGEVLEHLYDPRTALKNCVSYLNPDGYLILTTPNLASIYNRLLLLLGYPLYNYNPIDPTEHRVVLTCKQLTDLLTGQGFKVCYFYGFSYAEKSLVNASKINLNPGSYKLAYVRRALNPFLPVTQKEGLIFVCQKSEEKKGSTKELRQTLIVD
jgi:SAM-dependent methyltransferase